MGCALFREARQTVAAASSPRSDQYKEGDEASPLQFTYI